ncbi:hypothetical protein [uncultured Mediterranean phage uvMED]|nr:hypothetical protein [uncultured Mediterranean phage uvMED]
MTANRKISQLPETESASGDDTLPIVDASLSTTKKIKLDKLFESSVLLSTTGTVASVASAKALANETAIVSLGNRMTTQEGLQATTGTVASVASFKAQANETSIDALDTRLTTAEGLLSTTGTVAAVANAKSLANETAINNLGTSASLDAGTTANNVVQLNAQGKLPAVDASLLTNVQLRLP